MHVVYFCSPIYLYGEQSDNFMFTYRLNNYSYFESFDGIEPNLSIVSFIKEFSAENLTLTYGSAAFTCSAMS
jgi:energy-converting hydrogenase Eha subunit H